MERSGKRGKIPPQDWPSIITRYQSGETLASISRTYDCSPPAISYIVSRSRARNAAAEAQGAALPQEPQLVKSHPTGTPLPGTSSTAMPSAKFIEIDSPPAASAPAAAAPGFAEISGERADTTRQPDELRLFVDEPPPASIFRSDPTRRGEDTAATERQMQRPRDPQPSGNGNAAGSFAAAAAPPPNGEPRRTLHLSLSGSDGSHRHEPQPHASHGPAVPGGGERVVPQQTSAHPGTGPTARHGMGQYVPAGNGAPMRSAQEPQATRDGGTFIDQALRERVEGDIAAFLAAFDAALDHDTVESRAGLREATDRLLRAGARTRIELERLEARVPLVSREKSGQEARAFRPR
jgi:hypothetical protein